MTSGPAGVAGYTSARQAVRPVYAFWPALIAKSRVDPHIRVTVRTAFEWLDDRKEQPI